MDPSTTRATAPAFPVSPQTTRLSQDTLSALAIEHPTYDRSAITPGIVHFGAGAFHRAHQAAYLDTLMERGLAHDFGIVGVETAPSARATTRALNDQDGLYTLLIRRHDGPPRARVIGSIQQVLYAPEHPDAVLDRLCDPATRIVSLTVGQRGYPIDPDTGMFDRANSAVRDDLEPGGTPHGVFGFIVEALRRRREAAVPAFTVMSCDDLPGNGDITRRMLTALATLWDDDLGEWVEAEVHCPGSTLDRIAAPASADGIRHLSTELGIADACPVATEAFSQWALEDDFPTGRPPYERALVQLTDNVVPFGLMKLRLVGASRQALAYLGRVAGYRWAHEVCDDHLFVDFLLRYIDTEILPTLPPVPGMDLHAYCRSLIGRLANPRTPQPLAELCRDGSELIPLWLTPLIEDDVRARVPVRRSSVVLAAWARYAEGVDDRGEPIEVLDPLSEPLMATAARHDKDPLALLRNPMLFGGLIETPEFLEPYGQSLRSLQTKGVRRTLEELAAAPDETPKRRPWS